MNIDQIKMDLETVRKFFTRVVKLIPPFNVADPNLLPYGLKPHTRSVSWLVEQVIVQQARYNSEKLSAKNVDYDLPDSCLHDCVIELNSGVYNVNIKITSVGQFRKKDIASAKSLLREYGKFPTYDLIYAVFPFKFDNTLITLNQKEVHTFSPQFLPIYVNPRNRNLQANFFSEPQLKSRKKFLEELNTAYENTL